MDQETKERFGAIETRLVALESQPIAALKVTETKPKRESKRGTNPLNLTDEQRQEHADRLRKGKLAAKAKREAEAKVPAAASPEEKAEADAKATIAEAELPKDETGIANRWDNALTIPQRSKLAKKIGLDGKLGSSSWKGLSRTDQAAIIEAQNAKKAKAEAE